MNKTKKNIVIVGFDESEIRSIDVPEIGKNHYFNTMEEIKGHQGYLIIIKNKDNINIVDFDKKYRKALNNYANVWLYNENYNNSYHKWSNIEFVNRDIFLLDILSFWDQYDEYKHHLEQKQDKKEYTNKRLNNIEKIYNYLKKYKVIKTVRLTEDLKMSERMIQRYMQDINDIYHNIGYDYSNNEWYIVW